MVINSQRFNQYYKDNRFILALNGKTLSLYWPVMPQAALPYLLTCNMQVIESQ